MIQDATPSPVVVSKPRFEGRANPLCCNRATLFVCFWRHPQRVLWSRWWSHSKQRETSPTWPTVSPLNLSGFWNSQKGLGLEAMWKKWTFKCSNWGCLGKPHRLMENNSMTLHTHIGTNRNPRTNKQTHTHPTIQNLAPGEGCWCGGGGRGQAKRAILCPFVLLYRKILRNCMYRFTDI